MTTSADGAVETCRVLQSASSPGGPLRTHRISIRAYGRATAGLAARAAVDLTVAGAITPVLHLVGHRRPDLVVLNAPAKSYVKVRLDELSRDTLKSFLGELDADTRAVCWIAGREMVKDNLMPTTELRSWVAEHGKTERDPQVRDFLATS